MPEDRKDLREITLAVNVPVVVKPWRCRGVKTKYGDKLILVVREGNEDAEVKWLPVDLANDLVAMKVMELGHWDDGNVKYSIRQGAPDIVIGKVQAPGDKNPHYEVHLAGEDSGPEMPAKPPVSPPAARTATGLAPTPVAQTPQPLVTMHHECVKFGAQEADKIAELLVEPELRSDPIVAAALLTLAGALANTAFISRSRG
jgi:hypothetical protein